MKKPKAEPQIYEGFACDSKSEVYTLMYLFELQSYGFIQPGSIKREATTFKLSDPVVKNYTRGVYRNIVDTEMILDEHVYTPDFEFDLTPAGLNFTLFKAVDSADKIIQRKSHFILHQNGHVIIETKGTDFRHTNNTVEKFMVSRKWVYSKYGVWINLFFPANVFQKTFTPAEYWWTDAKRQQRKIPWKVIQIQEFINNNNP